MREHKRRERGEEMRSETRTGAESIIDINLGSSSVEERLAELGIILFLKKVEGLRKEEKNGQEERKQKAK
jgi:hypothetical protein